MGARTLVLGPLAIFVIWWRSKNAERSVALRLPPKIAARLATVGEMDEAPAGRTVLVIRLPILPNSPSPAARPISASPLSERRRRCRSSALLGPLLHRHDRRPEREALQGLGLDADADRLLFYSTPQFVYYLMPIAVLVAALVTIGTLSKTGELTVMRSCGRQPCTAVVCRCSSPARYGPPCCSASRARPSRTPQQEKGRPRKTSSRTGVVDDDRRHEPALLAGTRGRIYYYGAYDQRKRQFVNPVGLRKSPSLVPGDAAHVRAESLADAQRMDGRARLDAELPPGRTASAGTRSRPRALALDSPRISKPRARAAAMTVSPARRVREDLESERAQLGQLRRRAAPKYAMPLMTLIMTLIAIPFGVTTGRRGALLRHRARRSRWRSPTRSPLRHSDSSGAAELLPAALARGRPNLLFLAGASYLLFTVRT
jgi:hypothetical protein